MTGHGSSLTRREPHGCALILICVTGLALALSPGCSQAPPSNLPDPVMPAEVEPSAEPSPPEPQPGPPDPRPTPPEPQPATAPAADPFEADPLGQLRAACDRCQSLTQYRLTFYRQERLGTLIKKLSSLEEIHAAFRAEPFSVKFDWPSEDANYYESVYVAGQNGDKLVVRERKGIFPFPPQVRMIDVNLPAKLGKARNPITRFGLANTSNRIVALFDDPEVAHKLTITYQGVIELEETGQRVHHLRITQPPMPVYLHQQRDFYIDTETLLPAGLDLWLEPGKLDARYRYANVNTDVNLTDADFRLSKDHPDTEPAKKGK